MDFQTISVEYHKKICTLTLNRPRERNSMNQNMARDFREAIDKIKHAPDIRVLVLTGAGKTFCAGADLKMLRQWLHASPSIVEKELFDFTALFSALPTYRFPPLRS